MTTLFISHSSKDKAWAHEVHDRLRAQHYEALFLDSHPDDGIQAGETWEKTLYRRLRQSRGLVVLCTTNWLASPWCVAEAMMARERGKPVFMLASEDVIDDRQARASSGSKPPVQIPDFLRDTQFIPLASTTLEEGYDRLWKGLQTVLRPQDNFPPPTRPYPGLEPFDESEAGVFFGRDADIQRVEAVLTQRRRDNAEGFIVVLGASGCGKSSLVRAGVIPRLKRSTATDGAQGRWIIPTPVLAGRGLEGLIGSLSGAFTTAGKPQDLAALRAHLKAAREGHGGTASRALRELTTELLDAGGVPDGHVLLVVDQLEEVFDTPADSGARAMLRLLLETAADRDNPLLTLATMRSDFMNAFQLFPGTADRFKEIPLNPMSPARFGEVIEGPADRFGLRLKPGFTERLVEDTRHDDALPLLAFALRQLYEKGVADGILELKEYEALFPAVSVREPDGTKTTYRGVSAAIKHVADEILDETGYAGLATDDPRMRYLRRAFYSLARVGGEGQFTRRIARRSQMPPSCKEVLDRFVSRRLLVSGSEDGEPTLNVAHEALFRVWDTLRDWLLGARRALMLRAQIEDAAAEWNEQRRSESRAWSEERILDTVRQIGDSGVPLDDVASPDIVRLFLGPTEPGTLATLPALKEDKNETEGSRIYGEAWNLPLSHEARARLGVRLALLGDTRRGVGLREDGLPDIEWCRIDGGESMLEIRSDPYFPDSEVADRMKRSVERFWMARYPVTIAQFQAFLSDCYRDDSSSLSGNRWRLPPGIDLPREYPPPMHRACHGNHPADSVNWTHATAFCHWLGRRLHIDVRLPNEFEWQLAATGGDPERIYPWGHGWDPEQEPWRANTLESGLNRSTAVGMYPDGESPAKILDMAGTVFELCANVFERPDDIGFSGRADHCVVRGGSWNNNKSVARCVDRFKYLPDRRSSSVGFRVASSSSSLSPDH
jgi:formylglycine-generating enzyme required for sulfatase activity